MGVCKCVCPGSVSANPGGRGPEKGCLAPQPGVRVGTPFSVLLLLVDPG